MTGTLATLAWILSALLIVVGIAGTVLPALPGVVLVFAGIVLGAWIDDFARVSGWTVAATGVLGALAFATDYVAAALGAKKVGASRAALVGAAIGTVLGIVGGLVGLVFLPLAGAVAGELWAQRETWRHRATHAQAAKVGVATWIGLLVGTAVKVALVFAMVGVFVVALVF